jgi:hypothetical protein
LLQKPISRLEGGRARRGACAVLEHFNLVRSFSFCSPPRGAGGETKLNQPQRQGFLGGKSDRAFNQIKTIGGNIFSGRKLIYEK